MTLRQSSGQARSEKADLLRKIAQERILVKDGPYGTAIQAYKLDEAGYRGLTGCNGRTFTHDQLREAMVGIEFRDPVAEVNRVVAEIDQQDSWQRGVVACVTVSSDRQFAEKVLQAAEREAKRREAREDRPKTETAAAPDRVAKREAKKKLDQIEEQMGKLQGLLARIDEALAAPDAFTRDPMKANQLASQRADVERTLARLEEEWLMLSEEI